MRRVVVESPYAGDVQRNVEYARACIRDCLARGEAPIASHLLFTQPGILNDDIPSERERGMRAGWAWLAVAESVVFYVDHGTSNGMREAMHLAQKLNLHIDIRKIET